MEDKQKGYYLDSKTVFKGLRITIGLSLLFSAILILMTLDREEFLRAIKRVDFIFFIQIIVLVIINIVSAGIKFKVMIAATGSSISLKEAMKLHLAGSFISNVTPMATGGGPFQIYFLLRRGMNLGQSTTIVLTQFILRIFFFTFASLIFFIFFSDLISPGILPSYIFYFAIGIGFFITVSIIIISIFPSILDKLLRLLFKIRILKKLVKRSYKLKRFIVNGRKELEEFHQSMELLVKHKDKVFLAALSTFVFWTSMFMIIPVILRGLGHHPYYFRAYVMQTIFNLVIPYMPTPGASGVAELGFASIFITFIPRGIIGIVTLLWRFFTFYLILIIGGLVTFKELGWDRVKNE
ncbi:lysylphosphatidylglycerol synthase transmembrane domain-containing protein [Natronospora cellulosivora (SeqCode)]